MKGYKKILLISGIALVAIVVTIVIVILCTKHEHEYYVEDFPATCEQEGYKLYTCSCGDSYTESYGNSLGHNYNYVSNNNGTHNYVCNNDKSDSETQNCSFGNWEVVNEAKPFEKGLEKRTCSLCGYSETKDIPETHEHNYATTFTVDKEATCEEKGLESRHCTKDNCTSKIEETEIPALSHSYGEVEYIWADDFSSVTAQKVCNNNNEHKITETVETTYEVITEPTCNETGVYKYTSMSFSNSEFNVQTKNRTVNTLGHDWEAEFTWNYQYATVVLTCKRNQNHKVDYLSPTVDINTIEPASCEGDGLEIYTAQLEFYDEVFTDTKEQVLNAYGHIYNANFNWNEYVASAILVCTHDSSHIEEIDAVMTKEVIREATCTQGGLTKHKAEINFNNQVFSSEKDETINAVDHVFNKIVYDKNPTYQEEGTAIIRCKYDCLNSEKVDLPKLNDTDYVVVENVSGDLKVYTYVYKGLELIFNINAYNLDISSNNDEYGTISGSTKVYETSMTTVTATPNEGYKFHGWYVGDELISDEAEYSFVMGSEDSTLVARFTKGNYELINKNTDDVWDGSIADGFQAGTGTEESPFIISTAAELAFLAKHINENTQYLYCYSHFKLGNNIDLNNIEWDPIGSACQLNNPTGTDYGRVFQGVFDGAGYVISNLKITTMKNSSYTFFGLFGFNTGKIKNLGIENIDINVTAPSRYIECGGVAGRSNGSLENVYTTGNITATARESQTFCGGLVGSSGALITNCYSTSNVSGISYAYLVYAGGLTGKNTNTITNSFASGNVYVNASNKEGFASYVGGITGETTYNKIIGCYKHENQQITHSGKYNKNEEGLVYTVANAESSSFYYETLGFNNQIWSFDNNKLTLNSSDSGNKVFYQLFIEENIGGTVNYNEAIIKAGYEIELIVTENDDYEFVGWYCDNTLLSSEKTFKYVPTQSTTIYLVFNLKN